MALWRADRWGPYVLGAFAALSTWPGLAFRGETFAERDLHSLIRPYRHVLLHTWATSEGLPVWSELGGNGEVVAANPHHAVFHPLTWLFGVLPFEVAFRLQVLLPLLLTFWGARWLFRSMGSGPLGVLFGPLAWTLSGVLLSSVNLLPILLTVAPLPALLAAATRLLRSYSPAALVGTAGLLGLCIVGGEPSTILAIGVALAAVSAAEAPSLRSATRIAAAGLLGLALAGAVVVPAWRLVASGTRLSGVEPSEALSWTFPLSRAPELVAPRIPGHPFGHDWAAAYPDRGFPLLYSIYPGILVVAMAAAAVTRPSRRRLAWACAAVLALLVAAGTVRGPFLAAGLRYPEKWLVLAGFALVVLATDVLSRRTPLESPVSWACLAAAGLAAAAPVVARALGTPGTSSLLVGGLVAASVAAAGAAAARWRPAALPWLLAIDLAVAGHGITSTAPPSEVNAVPPAVAELRGSNRPRALVLSDWARTGAGVSLRPVLPYLPGWGIATAFQGDRDRTHSARSHRAAALFWQTSEDQPASSRRLLQRRGVGAIVSGPPDSLHVASLPDPQPEVQCAASILRFSGDSGWHRTMSSLEGLPAPTAMFESSDTSIPDLPSPCEVHVTYARSGRREAEVGVPGPGPAVLLLNQTWQPDWRASVNAVPARVWPVDIDLVGIVVPPGRHQVAHVFRDRSLVAGLAVTATGIVAVLALLALPALPAQVARWRRRGPPAALSTNTQLSTPRAGT